MSEKASFTKKVVLNGLWVFGQRAGGRLLGLVRNIILARLLFPDDFGLIGLAMIAVSALDCASQVGFQQALVQERQDIRPYLDTAWAASAMRSGLLFAAMFIAAPHVADFFREGRLTEIIRVVALSYLLYGFMNVGVLYFEKNLQFHRQFIYEATAHIVDVAVSLLVALATRDVWALVWGGLAGNLTRCILSYVLHPYRPSFRFDIARFRELFRFGRWVFLSGVAGYAAIQLDSIVVGRMLSATHVGYYQLAALFSSLPATEVAIVLAMVLFPSYAKLQGEPGRLREAHRRVLQFTALLCIPMGCGTIALAPELTRVLLGETWLPVIPVIEILGVLGISRAFEISSSTLFMGMGRPQYVTRMTTLQLVLLAMGLYPSIRLWGLEGAALSAVAASLAVNGAAMRKAAVLTGLAGRDLLRLLAAPAGASALMTLGLAALKPLLACSPAGLAALVFSGIAIYGLAIVVIDNRFLADGYRTMGRALLGSLKGGIRQEPLQGGFDGAALARKKDLRGVR